MSKLVECVPNFSEGRDAAVIRSIAAEIEAVRGVTLLDVDPGADTNRTVITFVGPPEAVVEAAFRASQARRRNHRHDETPRQPPRMGATDVCPFVPCRRRHHGGLCGLARTGMRQRVGDELGIPVYLYEHGCNEPVPQQPCRVRAGEYEGLASKLRRPGLEARLRPGQAHTSAGA